MSNFEWHTEDDEWHDESPTSAENPPRRRWLFSLGLLALILLVGAIVFTQLRETVNEATVQVEDDVQAAFELLHRSAENGDIELFSTYLSGRDREWTAGYQQLAGNGSLIEREALRLDLVSEQPEVVEIVIGADLRSAVLTATTEYALPIGNGLSQTIRLQQPYHFRQGETRWLFAPPEDEFWGEQQFGGSSRLLYSYPERDRAIVLRLMRDIDAAFDNLCSREANNIDCFNKWQIRFDESPLQFADLTLQPDQVNLQNFTVPTPSLVGLPINEDGYRALLSGYSRLIFTTIFADQIGYTCCEREPLFHALVDQISAELGLRANLDAPEHFYLAQQYLERGDWPFDWDGTFEDSDVSVKVNYTLVSFLRRQYPSISAYEMLVLLPRYDNRATWMQQVVATIDTTANSTSDEAILEANFANYRNWLEQRLDSYARQ